MSYCPLVKEVGEYGSVKIRFKGEGEASHKASAWLSGEIGTAVPVEGVTEVGVDGDDPAVENICYWLEAYAVAHPGASSRSRDTER